MGKNQQHKAMQRGKGSEEDGPPGLPDEPGADVSFHTAEWHAARIAALTTERLTWEDWKKVQKDNAAKAAKVAEDEESQMREYRAQLDADRNAKLSKGTNNAHLRAKDTKLKKKSKKRKDDKKESKSKKKKKRKERGNSSSSSDQSGSDSELRKSEKREHRKKKKRRSSKKHSPDSSDGNDTGSSGPVRLSEFLKQS